MNTRSVPLTLPFLALFVGIGHFTAAQGPIVEPADTVVIHGRVYTEDPRQPWAQAVAIHRAKIEVGKLADLIILSQNIFDISPHKIEATKVVTTIVGGQVVYQADSK